MKNEKSNSGRSNSGSTPPKYGQKSGTRGGENEIKSRRGSSSGAGVREKYVTKK